MKARSSPTWKALDQALAKEPAGDAFETWGSRPAQCRRSALPGFALRLPALSTLRREPDEIAHAADLYTVAVAWCCFPAFGFDLPRDIPPIADGQRYFNLARIDAGGIQGIGKGVEGAREKPLGRFGRRGWHGA